MPSISDVLHLLESLNEGEFRELILLPLFASLGYKNIRLMHGADELGKDIVFRATDPLRGELQYACVVKSQKLTGDVSSNRSVREVLYQSEQAFRHPIIDITNGSSKLADHIFIVSSYPISARAITSIQFELSSYGGRFTVLDGQAIASLILEHDPTLVASAPDPERRYMRNVASKLVEGTDLARFGGQSGRNISNFYIPARLRSIDPLAARYLSFGHPISHDPQEYGFPQIVAEGRSCVLVADLGSGKSSALHTYVISTAAPDSAATNAVFFVPLHALPKAALKDYDDFPSHRAPHFRSRHGNLPRLGQSKSYIPL